MAADLTDRSPNGPRESGATLTQDHAGTFDIWLRAISTRGPTNGTNGRPRGSQGGQLQVQWSHHQLVDGLVSKGAPPAQGYMREHPRCLSDPIAFPYRTLPAFLHASCMLPRSDDPASCRSRRGLGPRRRSGYVCRYARCWPLLPLMPVEIEKKPVLAHGNQQVCRSGNLKVGGHTLYCELNGRCWTGVSTIGNVCLPGILVSLGVKTLYCLGRGWRRGLFPSTS